MKKSIKLFVITLAVFLLIDLIWLTQIANQFYQAQIGYLLTDTPNLIAAFIFYILFVIGLIIFTIQPGLKQKSLRQTIIKSAFFGLVTYATYDLTNQATIEDWPVIVTIVDMAWGSLLGGMTGGISFFIYNKLSK